MPAKTFELSNTEHYQRVANIYRDALSRGIYGPSAEVARTLGVPHDRARTWVSKARQHGFLGPALGRTAGEVDTRFADHEGAEFTVKVMERTRPYEAELRFQIVDKKPVLFGFSVVRRDGHEVTPSQMRTLPLIRWTQWAIAAAGYAAQEGRYEASVEVGDEG